MTTYLITGGAGFIGSHLADALLAEGHRVLVIDNLSTGSLSNIEHLLDDPNFRFARADIASNVVLDRLASESDVILHMAAAVGDDFVWKVRPRRQYIAASPCVVAVIVRLRIVLSRIVCATIATHRRALMATRQRSRRRPFGICGWPGLPFDSECASGRRGY